MILSGEGKIVAGFFVQLPAFHKRIILDEWIVNPHQRHPIHPTGTQFFKTLSKLENPTTNQIKQYRKLRRKMIIPKIMGKLQMQSSKYINLLNNTPANKTWQTGYHDHIVRNDSEFMRIKYYIRNNPKNWKEDTFF